MARKERESDKREMADLLVVPRPAQSVQNGAGFSRKSLNIFGLLKKKEWPQCHRESSWQECRSCYCQKKQSRQSKVPYHMGERVNMSESRTLKKGRGGSEKEHEEGRVDSTVKEGRFQREKGGKARRASLEQVAGSMSRCVGAKALQDDLQSLGFTPSLAKPEIGNEVGR